MKYVSLGYDCSPAFALRDLSLRDYALPFDWVQSNYIQIMTCISDNFCQFHKDIQIIDTPYGQRAVDAYGIEYPHDYPTIDSSSNSTDGFYNEHIIIPNYTEYTNQVLSKYQRRIDRFREIFSSKEKIIILYRGHPMAAAELKRCLEFTYKHKNILFVVATKYTDNMKNRGIFVCDPEKNGNWNETTIWSDAIKHAIEYRNPRVFFSMNLL
jgi:hypothetical protein